MIVEGRHQELGKGVFISDIQPGSAAEQSGLAVGDMILCVNQVDLVGSDYETVSFHPFRLNLSPYPSTMVTFLCETIFAHFLLPESSAFSLISFSSFQMSLQRDMNLDTYHKASIAKLNIFQLPLF